MLVLLFVFPVYADGLYVTACGLMITLRTRKIGNTENSILEWPRPWKSALDRSSLTGNRRSLHCNISSAVGNNPPNLWNPKLSAFSVADDFSLLRIFRCILKESFKRFNKNPAEAGSVNGCSEWGQSSAIRYPSLYCIDHT